MNFIRTLISFVMLSALMGCGSGKQEFIPLDHMTFTNSYDKNKVKISVYVLIANPDADHMKLKTSVIQYVKKRLQGNDYIKKTSVSSINFVFYQKNRNTFYFIDHNEENNKLNSNEISHYPEDYIANYNVVKCDGGFAEKIYLFDRPEEIVSSNCNESSLNTKK